VLTGGFDFELTLSNGSVELEQVDVLRANDGTLIYMRSCGVAPPGASEIRIVPDFEVANSRSLAWLNTGKFVGTRVLDGARNSVRLEVYDVANVTDGEPRVRLTDPTDKPQQPWNCSSAGGTAMGRFTGSILPGGADCQLVGSPTTLDARYVLRSNDGELVLVRNCGPFGALVPLFEAKADGPYAFLNSNDYVSSDPGTGGERVDHVLRAQLTRARGVRVAR
jgi:hypothetical protein